MQKAFESNFDLIFWFQAYSVFMMILINQIEKKIYEFKNRGSLGLELKVNCLQCQFRSQIRIIHTKDSKNWYTAWDNSIKDAESTTICTFCRNPPNGALGTFPAIKYVSSRIWLQNNLFQSKVYSLQIKFWIRNIRFSIFAITAVPALVYGAN